jgi:hypothetical protein
VPGWHYVPSRGDRIEQTRLGVRRSGTVWYADELQILVKWDDGGSNSLRPGAPGVRFPDGRPDQATAKDILDVLRPESSAVRSDCTREGPQN